MRRCSCSDVFRAVVLLLFIKVHHLPTAAAMHAVPVAPGPILKDAIAADAYVRGVVPGAGWVGAARLLLTWSVVVGLLGLCLRVHPLGARVRGREERERRSLLDQEERSARRQHIMWERKARNREKFAARREARQKN